MAKSKNIHDQQSALSVYFNDMLDEQAAESQHAPTKPSTTETIFPAQTVKQTTILPAQVLSTEPADQPATSPSQEQEKTNDLEGKIRLLLFKTAEMELAVPVNEIDNIIRWPDKSLTRFPDTAVSTLGIYSNMGSHTEVIDIQSVLAPQNTKSNQTDFAYIVLVNNSQYGIAVEQIRQIINIPQKEVNWRPINEKRPWFKGVVCNSMSSILDINVLISTLKAR